MYELINRSVQAIKNTCFPIKCCGCNHFVSTDGLCNECWKKIQWISDPKCKICGIPFETDISALCPICLKTRPHFDKAISVFNYDDFSKNMILKFKHGDATYMNEKFAHWIFRASENDIRNASIIVPVPMLLSKRLKRKYNQSELLAIELAKLSGIRYEPRILEKTKHTQQQEGLSRAHRLKNVKGSFGVNEDYSGIVCNKIVVLVDDVITTGSTVNECAKVLKKSGADKVIVLTIARVRI